MPSITLSFLISINISEFSPKIIPESKKKKHVSNKESKKGSSLKSKKKEKVIKGPSKKKEINENNAVSDTLIEVGAPVGFLHIEYELLPKITKCSADVVYWKRVAKIFISDEERSVLTIEKDNKIWIPFCVKHYFDVMDEYINQIHDHVINITMQRNKAKICPKARSEKTKLFYIRTNDKGKLFVEAFAQDPNTIYERSSHPSFIILKKLDRSTVANSNLQIVQHFLPIPGLLHRRKIIMVMNNNKTLEIKSYVPACGPWKEEIEKTVDIPKPKKKGKKEKLNIRSKSKSASSKFSTKSKKVSKKTSSKKSSTTTKAKRFEIINVLMSGEMFFTNSNSVSIFKFQIAPECTDIDNEYPIKLNVLVSSNDMLHKDQIEEKNPLIIKIKNIYNFPIEVSEEQGFTHVYAHYKIPYLTQCTTQLKPCSNLVIFNEEHAHFTDECNKSLLIEYLQSNRLIIEIKGRKYNWSKKPNPHLFGEEAEDPQISDIIKERKHLIKKNLDDDADTILAVASFDLSQLLKPRYMLTHSISSSCRNPDSSPFRKVENQQTRDMLTPKNFPANTSYLKSSPFADFVLLNQCTNLEIEVSLSAPLPFLEIFSREAKYSRMFLIVRDKALAFELIATIVMHNIMYLDGHSARKYFLKVFEKNTSVFPNFRSSRNAIMTPEEEDERFFHIITGFAIDNGDWLALFIEGINYAFMNIIWDRIMHVNEPAITIHFNSELIFERRLYTDFADFGGIYHVTFQRSIEEIFKNEKAYLVGYVPTTCWEGLKKLNLLLKSKTMRIMCQTCLFPTSLEILAINLEFGVPIHMKLENNSLVTVPESMEDEVDKFSYSSKSILAEEFYSNAMYSSSDVQKDISVISCC